MTRKRLALLVAFFSVALAAFAAPKLTLSLDNNSDWDLSLDATDLTGAAGTDFPANIESDPAAQNLEVKNSVGNWRIDVIRGGEPTWHSGILIYVRRTSDGDAGTVSGGTTYQEITTVDTTFFTGTGNPRYIALQFMTNGAFASAAIPADSYTTTVTYTVTDNL